MFVRSLLLEVRGVEGGHCHITYDNSWMIECFRGNVMIQQQVEAAVVVMEELIKDVQTVGGVVAGIREETQQYNNTLL